mmetsp:Transcript_24861/g.56704  ORF Transcript_24861/g.56704 Transcript_24861/m.56704 type:complete len:208 (+) Transcript_24861:404-1027(+)
MGAEKRLFLIDGDLGRNTPPLVTRLALGPHLAVLFVALVAFVDARGFERNVGSQVRRLRTRLRWAHCVAALVGSQRLCPRDERRDALEVQQALRLAQRDPRPREARKPRLVVPLGNHVLFPPHHLLVHQRPAAPRALLLLPSNLFQTLFLLLLFHNPVRERGRIITIHFGGGVGHRTRGSHDVHGSRNHWRCQAGILHAGLLLPTRP